MSRDTMLPAFPTMIPSTIGHHDSIAGAITTARSPQGSPTVSLWEVADSQGEITNLQVVSFAGLRFGTRKKSRILLVKKRDFWFLPGGKIKPAESELDCLFRGLEEELGKKTTINFSTFYRTFNNLTTPSGKSFDCHLYIGYIRGKIEINPDDSVTNFGWFSTDNLPKNISTATQIIIASFKTNGYFDEIG